MWLEIETFSFSYPVQFIIIFCFVLLIVRDKKKYNPFRAAAVDSEAENSELYGVIFNFFRHPINIIGIIKSANPPPPRNLFHFSPLNSILQI